MYDGVMDRMTRWVPDLEDHFERAAAASLEECVAQRRSGACRGCEIDGVHVECSFSTRVRGGKAVATSTRVRGVRGTSCLLCSETRLKTLGKIGICSIGRPLKAYSPVAYDAAVDRITRWVPELKDTFEPVSYTHLTLPTILLV